MGRPKARRRIQRPRQDVSGIILDQEGLAETSALMPEQSSPPEGPLLETCCPRNLPGYTDPTTQPVNEQYV